MKKAKPRSPLQKPPLAIFADNGILSILSLDRTDPISRALSAKTAAAILEFKRQALDALAPHSTAIMLDEAALKKMRKNKQKLLHPLVLALECPGVSERRGERITRLRLRPAAASRLGAIAAKLQIHYNPRYLDSAEAQLELAKEVKQECDSAGLPVFLEILPYEVPTSLYEHAVFEAAEKFSPYCELLITDFPSSSLFAENAMRTCLHFSQQVRIPWLLTGYMADPAQFCWRLEAACRGGASGFVAGSAVWADGLRVAPKEMRNVLETLCASRLMRFRRISEKNGMRV